MNPRLCDMVFSSIIGFCAGAICIFVGAGPWLTLAVGVMWTAGIFYKFTN